MSESQKNIEPFPFEKLPQLSYEKIEMQKQLNKWFHLSQHNKVWKTAVERALAQTLNYQAQTKVLPFKHYEQSDLDNILGEKNIILVFQHEASLQNVAVILDFPMAFDVCELVLSSGKRGMLNKDNIQNQSITPLQVGVLEYFAVSFCKELKKQNVADGMGFSFQQILLEPKACHSHLGQYHNGILIPTKVVLPQGSDFVNIVVSYNQMVESVDVDAEEKYFEQRLNDFLLFKCSYNIEVGQVSLEPDDLSALDEGDIILFDESEVKIENNTVSGKALMKLKGFDDSNGIVIDLDVKNNLGRGKVLGRQ